MEASVPIKTRQRIRSQIHSINKRQSGIRRELISKDKKCRHCEADDPLTLEDIDNLLSYLVVIGLKNNELIDYLFDHIDITKTEFTTELLRENVIAFHSKKSNKSNAGLKAKVAKNNKA